MKAQTSTVHESNENKSVTFYCLVDPTASAVAFQLTARDARVDAADWVAGAWTAAGWDSATGRVTATTPLLGNGATLATTAASKFILWARVLSVVVLEVADVTVV